MSKSSLTVIIPGIQKRHGMVCLGSWNIRSPFLHAPMQRDENDTSKQDAAEMSLTSFVASAVAAATGPGFKSRRPDSCHCHYFDAQAVKKASINSGSSSL